MAFKIIRNEIKNVSADAVVEIDAAAKDDLKTGEAWYKEVSELNAKYIIYACPGKNSYENALSLAKNLDCGSIAFPLVSKDADALSAAISSFREFLEKSDMEIILAVPDGIALDLSGDIFLGIDAFLDENYVSGPDEDDYEDEEYDVASLEEEAIPTPPAERPGKRSLKGSLFRRHRKGASEEAVGAAARETSGTAANEVPLAQCMAMPAASAMRSSMGTSKPKSARTLEDVMAHIGETFTESLLRLIDEKGFTDTEVYKRANVDRKLFSKIRCNRDYQPKKITAVSFALALHLSLDETKDLLGRAGYALSPGSRFDLIIQYFIENEVYDTYTINLALFEHDQPLLGE